MNSTKISIREVKGKGNGLFVDENQLFSIGEKILHEFPLFLTQRIQSKKLFGQNLICNYCLGFIGSLGNQFKKLLLFDEKNVVIENYSVLFEKLPIENQKLPIPIACDDCKETFYCSNSCLEKDKKNCHEHVCHFKLKEIGFLENQLKFEKLCLENELENLILAQKIFLSCLKSKENEIQVKKFCLEKWSQISNNISLATKFLNESWNLIEPLFNQISKSDPKCNSSIINLDFFDKILGNNFSCYLH